MSEYKNLIIAVAILISISIINQSVLQGMSISDSGPKDPTNPQANTFEGEKLPRTIILDPHEMLKMKQAIMKQNDSIAQDFLKTIITEADSVLHKRPISVTEKTELPPNGTKHDYFALASYEWPNPNTSNGLPYVSRDGQTNPETLLIKDRKYLEEMVDRVMILALASYFTDNPKYALKAQELLRVWFLDKDTYMEPSLKYGDFERGKGRLNPSGIIGAHHLAHLVDAIGMLELSPKWSKSVQEGIEQWFSKYLDWLLNSDLGKREGQRANNHGTYYAVQLSAIAFLLNKPDITKQLLKSTMQGLSNAPLENVSRLISVKINPDGTQPFEISRANSLHYHIWNLYGLDLLARIGDQLGVDLWNYQIHGGGIRKALDFTIPYALGNQTWPYSKIKVLSYDDLSFLKGIVCQAILHYDRQPYIQAYRSLEAKNLPLRVQDSVCDIHIKYIDSGSLKN
jgi:Alginate lyase